MQGTPARAPAIIMILAGTVIMTVFTRSYMTDVILAFTFVLVVGFAGAHSASRAGRAAARAEARKERDAIRTVAAWRGTRPGKAIREAVPENDSIARILAERKRNHIVSRARL